MAKRDETRAEREAREERELAAREGREPRREAGGNGGVQKVGGSEPNSEPEVGSEDTEETKKAEPKGPTEYDEGGYEQNTPA